MIEQGLILGLGFLVAALIWLMLLPAFWSRAVRLTRERIERSLPLSLNEITAERDRLRAEQAVTLRRMEQEVEQTRLLLAETKAQTGQARHDGKVIKNQLAQAQFEHKAQQAELSAKITALEIEIKGRDEAISSLKQTLTATEESRDNGIASINGLSMQREALAGKLASMTETAEQRRIALHEASLLAERLQAALDEETQRNAQLRNDLQAKSLELREAERRAQDIENDAALRQIRKGQSSAPEPNIPASG